MKLGSLSARLGLSISLTSAALVIAIATLAYFAITHQLDIRARDALEEKADQVRHTIDELSAHAQIKRAPHALRDQLLGHAHLTLQIFDSPDLKSPLLRIGPAVPELQAADITDTLTFQAQRLKGGTELLTGYQSTTPKNLKPLYIALSYNRIDDDKLVAALGRYIAFGIPIVLAIVGFGAWLMVQRGLKPLRDFSHVAGTVTVDNLSQRLELSPLPDELRELGHAMNFMLHRLDSDVQQLIRFSDDLAHELRSPIANLLGKAQVALSRPRTAQEYESVLVYSIEELERLGALVAQLLFLANVTNLQAPVKLEQVDLRSAVESVAELFSPEAEERQIEIRLEGYGHVMGDPLMIRRAISNLLANALRHSSAGEPVRIDITHRERSTCLRVTNGGDYIPQEHLDKLFDRFYRVEASRSRSQGGTGLGLAIVRSIMRLHGGSVTVTSAPGDTAFTLVFP